MFAQPLNLAGPLERLGKRWNSMKTRARSPHEAGAIGVVVPLPRHEAPKLDRLASQLGIPRPPEPFTAAQAREGDPPLISESALIEAVLRKLRGT